MMRQTVVVAVALMALSVGMVMAACPVRDVDMMDPEMMGRTTMDHEYEVAEGPMMRMAGAMEMTSHGGYTYLLVGGTIEKRDAEGNVVATAELPPLGDEAQQIRQRGICPVTGAALEAQVDRDDRMQAARQRQMARVYGRTAIQADEDGVRVLRAGRMYVYDHDLNQQTVVEIVDPTGPGWANLCECLVAEAAAGDCPVCAIRNRWRGEPVEAALTEGFVKLHTRPAMRTPGLTRFGIHVHTVERDVLDADAQINAFVYPQGNPDAGMDVDTTRLGPGRFYGEARLEQPGTWELAVRVIRPGVEDERVYFDVEVGEPMEARPRAARLQDIIREHEVVRVTLRDGEIDMPETLSAGVVIFEVVNEGTLPHSIQFQRNDVSEGLGRNIAAGETGIMRLSLQPGTYQVICPVGDHAQQGMTTTVTVTQ